MEEVAGTLWVRKAVGLHWALGMGCRKVQG